MYVCVCGCVKDKGKVKDDTVTRRERLVHPGQEVMCHVYCLYVLVGLQICFG